MATTPIYNWPTPDNTDLVKNGALAIRTLGNSIDTTMDTMLAKTIVDAKGDLIAGTAADTAARLPVGADGTTIVADSSQTSGLRYTALFGANKNKIINGDFGIWQRGTTVTPASGFGYGADRWRTFSFGSSTSTLSQQSFTPGAAPVAGYEGTFFARFASTNTATYASQPIEDVRTFAGQTVTVSFYAKSASAQTLANVKFDQNFGSGGSSVVSTTGTPPAITTSFARYSVTIAVPSISGKTIGAGSSLELVISGAINNNLDLWGVQVEAGSVATAFQTATGTIQGETSACQRYYWRNTTGANFGYFTTGYADSTTTSRFYIQFPVTMRTIPTALDYSSGIMIEATPGAGLTPSTITLISGTVGTSGTAVSANFASGLTQYRPYALLANNTPTAYLGFTAEL